MASIRNLINRFIDWLMELGDIRRRYYKDEYGIDTADQTLSNKELEKITKIVDEKLFGIHRKNE